MVARKDAPGEGQRLPPLADDRRPLLEGLVLLLMVEAEQRLAQQRLVGQAARGALEAVQVGQPPGEHPAREPERAQRRTVRRTTPRHGRVAPRAVRAVLVVEHEVADDARRAQHRLGAAVHSIHLRSARASGRCRGERRPP